MPVFGRNAAGNEISRLLAAKRRELLGRDSRHADGAVSDRQTQIRGCTAIDRALGEFGFSPDERDGNVRHGW